MAAEITVPASYVKALLRSIELQGHDVNTLLMAQNISLEELDHDGELPAVLFGRLYQSAMSEMRDESIGMISASRVPIGSFRLMCYACIHAENLEKAIIRCSGFYDILRGSVIKPIIDVKAGYAHFRFTVIDALPEESIAHLLDNEEAVHIRAWFSMWHNFLSWLIGKRLALNHASFTFSKPSEQDYYGKLFQSEVRFSQEVNALVFPEKLLRSPLVQTEQSLKSFLKSLPYQLIVMLDEGDSMVSRVKAVIGNDFSRELPTADEVARGLGMSISSLRRRLLEEGTSFQKIKVSGRQAAAMRYLAVDSMSVHDVAVLTGFDDPSTFYRAFRQWTGKTPGQYRESLR